MFVYKFQQEEKCLRIKKNTHLLIGLKFVVQQKQKTRFPTIKENANIKILIFFQIYLTKKKNKKLFVSNKLVN